MDDPAPIRWVDFSRRKYGPELLVDVGWIHELPPTVVVPQPYRLRFYDILLVTRGEGTLWLDSTPHPLTPRRLIFTTPGQVRRFRDARVDGLCLFFAAEFLETFLQDPLFLMRLHYFHNPARPLSLELSAERARWLEGRLEDMRVEIGRLRDDSTHLLRAILYEVLVTMNRWFAEAYGGAADPPGNSAALEFRRLVEHRFARSHRVSEYARTLAITPGHLSDLTRRTFGLSPGALIRTRLVLEARRLLLHTDHTAGWIAAELGFKDPAYFSRFFRRETGMSPRTFRTRNRQKYPNDR